MIPLSVPNIDGNEWQYVKDCLDTGWISSAGAYVTKFEEAIQNYTGVKYAIALLNDIIIGGYCDLNKKNKNPYELNYLGEEQNLNSEQEAFICIADNIIRKNIYKSLSKLDFKY